MNDHAPTNSGTAEPVPNRRLGAALALCLVALTFLVYWPVRSFDFITAYDDQKYVTENPMVRNGLSPEAAGWAFTTGYASNWHPLTWVSHMLDVQLWGLKPGAHHLTNLCLHAANTLLLFIVLRRYTGALWRSAFVAALFAWHPLHIESVAWVAERKDVLSTFFMMLTLWAYGEYVRSGGPAGRTSSAETAVRPGRSLPYVLALVAFALGLMSKPMLVTLPFVLLLLDYWPLEREPLRNWGQLVLEKVPFLVLSAASSVVTFLVQRSGGAMATLDSLPLIDRAANAALSYVRYLGKTVWPEPLAIPYPFVADWPLSTLIGAFLLLGSVSAVAWMWGRRFPYLPVGWFWFLGTLVPVIGLVQVGGQAMADRYTYVPLIGIFIAAVWGVAELCVRFGQGRGMRLGAVAGGVALVVCLAATHAQLPHWRNSVELFRHAVTVTKNNATAHVNLGAALADEGKLADALNHYQAGLALRPGDAQALNGLGNLWMRAGKPAAALEFYEKALALKLPVASFYYNLGNARSELGQNPGAAQAYEEALRLDPNYARAHTALAVVLMRTGRLQEAWGHVMRSAELEPTMPENHNLLGNLLAAAGKHEEAVAAYREALRLDPRMAGVCLNLGNSLVRLGRATEACAALEHGIKLDPGLWQAQGRLAELYAELGNFPKAIENAERALQVAGNAGLKGVADELRQRLARYRAGEK